MACKRVAMALFAALLATSAFAGGQSEKAAQPQGGTTAPKTHIVWSEWWDSEWGKDNVQWVIDKFEASHPNISVSTVFAPNDKMFEKLTVLSQGQDAPDVMATEGFWLAALDKQGVVADLDPLLARDTAFKNSLVTAAFPKWKGKVKLIWLYMMGYDFFYNVDDLKKAQVDPPTNWDNLKTVLRKLKDPANNHYGLAIQLSLRQTEHMTTRMFMVPLVQFGGRMLDDSGKAVFNSQAGARALQYWKSLIDENLVYPNPLDTDPRDTYGLLASDAVSMMLIGPWVQSIVNQQNPNIQMAAAPPFKADSTGSVLDGSGIALSANTTKKDAAWEFMKYLWNDDVAVRMTKTVHYLWPNKSVMNASFLNDDPILRYMPQQISDPQSQSLPILPEQDSLYRILAENMQAYYLGNKTAQQALDDAAAQWNKVISEY